MTDYKDFETNLTKYGTLDRLRTDDQLRGGAEAAEASQNYRHQPVPAPPAALRKLEQTQRSRIHQMGGGNLGPLPADQRRRPARAL